MLFLEYLENNATATRNPSTSRVAEDYSCVIKQLTVAHWELRTLPLCLCPPNSIRRRIRNETDISGLLWHPRVPELRLIMCSSYLSEDLIECVPNTRRKGRFMHMACMQCAWMCRTVRPVPSPLSGSILRLPVSICQRWLTTISPFNPAAVTTRRSKGRGTRAIDSGIIGGD